MSEEREPGGVVVVVRGEGLGQVDPEDGAFGIEMLDLFCHVIEGREDRPETLCFYTNGVKLLARGSAILPSLQLLEGLGVELIACRTCLDRFGLTDRIGCGRVGSMKEIVDRMMAARKVITI